MHYAILPFGVSQSPFSVAPCRRTNSEAQWHKKPSHSRAVLLDNLVLKSVGNSSGIPKISTATF
ncbi:hypothetical protein H9L39_05670 [Fusarium oxysporum f. sp. albedinis]|nr:hypothetical protein FOMA001_g5426 [Fusarium oxysporum f. sp. matthiolae]KAK2483878.1 hypothetical protein H9L39_05670 [Fusarium oxysporum f. sp. albedinis]